MCLPTFSNCDSSLFSTGEENVCHFHTMAYFCPDDLQKTITYFWFPGESLWPLLNQLILYSKYPWVKSVACCCVKYMYPVVGSPCKSNSGYLALSILPSFFVPAKADSGWHWLLWVSYEWQKSISKTDTSYKRVTSSCMIKSHSLYYFNVTEFLLYSDNSEWVQKSPKDAAFKGIERSIFSWYSHHL